MWLRRRPGDGADGASRRACARHRRRGAQRPRGDRPCRTKPVCPSVTGRPFPRSWLPNGGSSTSCCRSKSSNTSPNPIASSPRLGSPVAPGGLLVIGTLNRTLVSFVKTIIGAEYVLGWLPAARTTGGASCAGRDRRHACSARLLRRRDLRSGARSDHHALAYDRSCSTNYLQIHRRRGEPKGGMIRRAARVSLRSAPAAPPPRR